MDAPPGGPSGSKRPTSGLERCASLIIQTLEDAFQNTQINGMTWEQLISKGAEAGHKEKTMRRARTHLREVTRQLVLFRLGKDGPNEKPTKTASNTIKFVWGLAAHPLPTGAKALITDRPECSLLMSPPSKGAGKPAGQLDSDGSDESSGSESDGNPGHHLGRGSCGASRSSRGGLDGGMVSQLRLKDLIGQFGMDMGEAASNLGVCKTTLKRACRRLGIWRWPSKKQAAVLLQQNHLKKDIKPEPKVPAKPASQLGRRGEETPARTRLGAKPPTFSGPAIKVKSESTTSAEQTDSQASAKPELSGLLMGQSEPTSRAPVYDSYPSSNRSQGTCDGHAFTQPLPLAARNGPEPPQQQLTPALQHECGFSAPFIRLEDPEDDSRASPLYETFPLRLLPPGSLDRRHTRGLGPTSWSTSELCASPLGPMSPQAKQRGLVAAAAGVLSEPYAAASHSAPQLPDWSQCVDDLFLAESAVVKRSESQLCEDYVQVGAVHAVPLPEQLRWQPGVGPVASCRPEPMAQPQQPTVAMNASSLMNWKMDMICEDMDSLMDIDAMGGNLNSPTAMTRTPLAVQQQQQQQQQSLCQNGSCGPDNTCSHAGQQVLHQASAVGLAGLAPFPPQAPSRMHPVSAPLHHLSARQVARLGDSVVEYVRLAPGAEGGPTPFAALRSEQARQLAHGSLPRPGHGSEYAGHSMPLRFSFSELQAHPPPERLHRLAPLKLHYQQQQQQQQLQLQQQPELWHNDGAALRSLHNMFRAESLPDSPSIMRALAGLHES